MVERSKETQVVIIGAGPSGLFAAMELAEDSNISVTVIDQHRTVGGSGLRSDGKLNFSYKEVGTEDLTQVVPEYEAIEIIHKIKRKFFEYGVDSTFPREHIIENIKDRCKKGEIEYIPVESAHIGSDRLNQIMKDIYGKLCFKGINFILNTTVLDITEDHVVTPKRVYPYDFLVVATGRTGGLSMKPIYDRLGIKYGFGSIDVGIRVEVHNQLTEWITDILGVWDPKFIMKSGRSKIRTFCTCPYGFVSTESYGKFGDYPLTGVNGYSNHGKKSINTNFALLTTLNLTEPFEDTTLLGQIIAYKTNLLGGGKPLIQTLRDFERHNRTTYETLKSSRIKPTLSSLMYTPGDLRFAYDDKTIGKLQVGLDKLTNLIPMYPDRILLYGPEIKFYARKIKLHDRFSTDVDHIYCVGDGSGFTRGIVGAGASGIIAARGIMDKY